MVKNPKKRFKKSVSFYMALPIGFVFDVFLFFGIIPAIHFNKYLPL